MKATLETNKSLSVTVNELLVACPNIAKIMDMTIAAQFCMH